MMSISVNSRFISIALTSFVILASNALVRAECIDSPLKMIPAGGTTAQNCEDLVNNVPFCTIEIASHCPLSCNACAEFECSDSDATFIYNEGERICSNAQSVPPQLMAQVCQVTRLAKTCRGVCNYCTVSTAVPSIDISSMPSMGPTVSPSSVPSDESTFMISTGPTVSQSSAPSEESSSMPSMSPSISSVPSNPPSVTPTLVTNIDMNFDEAGLDCDGPFDDYDYSYYYDDDDDDDCGNLDYYHTDITLVNFGYYSGHLSPGTGYDYGVVTPDNVSYNQFGDPAVIECHSGSFYIESMWINSAWQPNAPVDFIGIKNDGTTLDFSITLPNTTVPIKLDSVFDDFTDLDSLVINTPRDGDVAVIDGIQLGITGPCDMTFDFMASTEEEDEHNVFGKTSTTVSRPNFSPIYPRSFWNRRS